MARDVVIVVVFDDNGDCPVIFAYHFVPDGRPDSVKVTEYVLTVNVTDTDTLPPLTVTDEE